MTNKHINNDEYNLSKVMLERMDRDLKVRQEHLEHNQKDLKHRIRKTWLLAGAFALGPTLYMTTAFHFFGPKGISEDYAALIRIEGPISANSNASASRLVPALNKAFKDDLAKGIVLLINSPGGSPVQSSIVHDRIIKLRNIYPEKKVIAIGEDYLTSGAYFIATGAPEICVNKSTVTGSIGVIATGYGIQADKFLEKYGFERRVWTAGENKAGIDTFIPVTKKQEQKMKSIMDEMHQHFIESVKETRKNKITLSDAKAYSGEYWTGNKAVEAGLVDGLCDLNSILKEKFDVDVTADYTPPTGLVASLKRQLGTSSSTGGRLVYALLNAFEQDTNEITFR